MFPKLPGSSQIQTTNFAAEMEAAGHTCHLSEGKEALVSDASIAPVGPFQLPQRLPLSKGESRNHS
jgi:hypothetical protein